MLDVVGRNFTCCDGVTRRSVLRTGILSLGGLTLADRLRLRAQAAAQGAVEQAAGKSVIFIELAGGPSHFETYDPKPYAPKEYRGPLAAISTRLPGVHFSQHMQRQAELADRLAILRAVHHESSSHQTSAHLTQTGYYLRDRLNRDNEMPCAGSVAARLVGGGPAGIPPFVAIPSAMRYGGAAFLGKGFGPFETGGNPANEKFQVQNLVRNQSIEIERLADRRHLLAALDRQRQVVDNRGLSDALDSFGQQAFEIVTSRRAQEAFDIAREKDKVRDRYGRTTIGQSMLLARRLVEAGVTFVSVRVGGWDDHVDLVKRFKSRGPDYDRGLAALVGDLNQRGMDRDVLVVAMGEFGRTPRVNRTAGRDHWGSVMSVLVACGGLRMGQVVGSSSPKGETPQDAPYRPEDVLATIYRHVGIDPGQTFTDFAGRPRYVLERGAPVAELV